MVRRVLSQSVPERPIVFGAPFIGEEEIAEVVDTLRSGWLGTGPKANQFEMQFARHVGTRFALGTNSGTAALHLALEALGVGPGDEVITTPLTFAATANVIEHCGATPVFADVDPYDGNIDAERVVESVNARTKVVLPVHYAGAAAPIPDIRRLLPKMPIVVDAAHAVETRYADGASSAGHGALFTAYSFYVTKNVVTGEGGMLVTNNARLAKETRIRSLHGLDNDAWKRYSTNNGAGVYQVQYAGHKYNMTDIQASLGIHQLARVNRTYARRSEIWARYNAAFSDIPGVTIPPVSHVADAAGVHARHLYTLWFDWDELGFDRAGLNAALKAQGIGLGWHFPPLHLQAFYRRKYAFAPGDYPHAEAIGQASVSLPLSGALSDRDVQRVTDAIVQMVTGRKTLAWPAAKHMTDPVVQIITQPETGSQQVTTHSTDLATQSVSEPQAPKNLEDGHLVKP
jgi:dTDP-4-amino-4,6-dideoxygalactose transaminase